MFSKKQSAGIERTRLATLIAHDVRIAGDLQFSDGLRLDGSVQGNVSGAPGSQTLLVLSERGSIEGNVHGYDVVVNGTIVGDLIADHFVELQANAHVTGNITYQLLRMDVGASVDGTLTKRDGAQVAAQSAEPAPAQSAVLPPPPATPTLFIMTPEPPQPAATPPMQPMQPMQPPGDRR